MFRTMLLASSVAATALLGGVLAAGPAGAAPVIVGGGADTTVIHGPVPGNTIVGGAHATIEGGPRDLQYRALPGGRGREGRIGTIVGGGANDRSVRYQDGQPQGWAGTPADIDERGHRG